MTMKSALTAFCFLLLIAFCRAGSEARPCPQDGGQTRKLWDSEFFKSKGKSAPGKPAAPRRRYRIVTPKIPVDRVDGETVVGITLWRLRPSTAADDKQTRLLKHSKDNTKVPQ